MATVNRSYASARREAAAERVAGFGAEQRRLKAAAAVRREASATGGETRDASFSVRPERPPVSTPPSRYLQ